ncbi:MAG: helix-turn-helix transcriptional regulator [Bacilli bacterium]|nr:helix-turn-helix transcriptional regulator [Bacilli bacterium]
MDYVIGFTRKNIPNGKHEINLKIIGKNIKTLREKNNITQIQLAKLLNTSQSTISGAENGKNILLMAFALQIVQEYHVSLDWLCGRIK